MGFRATTLPCSGVLKVAGVVECWAMSPTPPYPLTLSNIPPSEISWDLARVLISKV